MLFIIRIVAAVCTVISVGFDMEGFESSVSFRDTNEENLSYFEVDKIVESSLEGEHQ